jgi:thiamine transport system permease protein
MALGPLKLSARTGPLALFCVVGPILAAGCAVLWRGGASGLGPGDLAAVRFTLIQAALSAAFSVLLAVPVARALARRQFPGRAALIAILGAPFILPVIVAVFGLLAVFGRAGWVSLALDALGLPPISIYGLHGVVLAHVFFNLPLATRLLLQGWSDIPAEHFRIAASLGFDRRTMFRQLERPMLERLVPGALALIFAVCLTSFSVALTLGGGPRATTIELAIYQAFLFDFDLGRAALLSLLQVAVAGLAAVAALRLIPTSLRSRGLLRPVARWDAAPLWRDALAIGLVALFLLTPLAAIVLRGLVGIPDLPSDLTRAIAASLSVALLSTLCLIVIALPLSAWLASRQVTWLESLGLVGLVVSPLTIGTGWFILINPVADPRAFALPVTALVNMLMALPFALRILVPPCQQALAEHGRLAQALNLRDRHVWRHVLRPPLAAPMGFAAGLCAALSIGDLGVITLFADPTRGTLPLLMYQLMGAYRMDAAAAVALILLVLAFGLFLAFDQGGRRIARL